jgi:hypothetical protein
MEDGHGIAPVVRAAAGQIWLEQRAINEHVSQQFQPSAKAPRVGTKIDEGGIAKLFGGWSVHVRSSILLTAVPPRKERLKRGQSPQNCQENQR